MVIVHNNKKALLSWASQGLFGRPDSFDEKATALGVIHNEKLICVVVYTDYKQAMDGSPLSIEMSIYSIDKRWATRQNIGIFFKYPFIQLGLKRVQTICSAHNQGVIMFNKRLGFKQEGLHREAFPDGRDAVSFGMLKGECKWLVG